jgi:WD40 repeat protein
MPLATISAAQKPLSACAVSADGQVWYSGSMEGMLTAWDPASQTALWTFMAHTRPISSIRFSPDGQMLATTSWDRQLALRRLGREREPRVMAGHSDIVAGCSFAAGGRQIFSWSYDGTVRLWDTTTAHEIGIVGDHGTRVTAGDVSPDGLWAVTGGMDGALILWSLEKMAEVGAAVLPSEVRALFYLPDGSSFLAADADGLLSLLSAPGFEVNDQLELDAKTQCGTLAPVADQLAIGGEDGIVRLIAIEGFEETALPVTVTQGVRQSSTGFDRLLGRTRNLSTFRFSCPSCREETEGTGTAPDGDFACPVCGRRLRVASTLPHMQSL